MDVIGLIPTWLALDVAAWALAHDLILELLPKFLPVEPSEGDKEKVEKLLEYMLEVRWKTTQQASFDTLYGVKEEPYLPVDLHWLEESLVTKKHAQQIGEKCSMKPLYMLADRLKEIFRVRNRVRHLDFSGNGVRYRTVVEHKADFDFSCYAGRIDEDEYSKHEQEERPFGRLVYLPKREIEFDIHGCEDKSAFVTQMTTRLRENVGEQTETDLDRKVGQLYDNMYRASSFIWFRSISDGPGWAGVNAKQLVTVILREIILGKVRKDKAAGREVVEQFLSARYQYPLFKRFVLFLIGEFWTDFQNIFRATLLNDKNAVQFFDDPEYRPELYTLLEQNSGQLSGEDKRRLTDIIEAGPQTGAHVEDEAKYISLWKQEWYSALKSIVEFKDLYEKHRKITGVEEHIPFKDSGVQIRTGPGRSPLSVEQILSLPNKEIADFVSTFKTKDWWNDPTEDALADTLTQAAKAQPDKFIDDMEPFGRTSYNYVGAMLAGLREAWDSRKSFDWGKLLEFVKGYTGPDDFWQDILPVAGDHWKPDHKSVISIVGELIQSGTKDDNWAFDEQHNRNAQKIIGFVIRAHLDDLINDPKAEPHLLLDVYTPAGNIVTALIYLSLRIARLQSKRDTPGADKSARWNDELKVLYEKVLEKGLIEAYSLLGQYLGNFAYLDMEWVKHQISDLEHPKDETHWTAFMTGYLNTVKVYDNLYGLDSMQRHYAKALNTAFDKHIGNRLVHHIAIGYLRGDARVFDGMLKEWVPSQVMEVIDFFARMSEYIFKPEAEDRDKLKERILSFWKRVYDKHHSTESAQTEDGKKILSSVSKLSMYLSEIDAEKSEWLALSAPYVHLQGNERWLTKELDRLKDTGDPISTARYILKIILLMLGDHVPTFGSEDEYMKKIVIHSYKLKNLEIKEMADEICNMYGMAGVHYLRQTWEKYHGQ